MYKIIKNVYKIRFRRDHFETCNIRAKRKGLSVVIKILSPVDCLPLPGAIYIIEPPHVKTNKMACAPSEDSDRPGHPQSLISLGCGGALWLSGRGRGFETYRRCVVSLSKTLYSPKVLVNYPGSGGSVPT